MSFEGVCWFFLEIFYNDLNIDSISHPFNHLSVVYRTFICSIYNAFFFALKKITRCRSPPFYQFSKITKLIGGKNGQKS